ncbi:hypothetical protein TELCIR_04421 [Teladorsagia circumcincta]|uniref:Uncharacterized protein n=1 Tax=Teladorsagia circumcincta TaxID=45464 RepID=A0A2G9UV56_TELCI|nr:hypothetical protein TELCIR_04421 [Teladorsagia circumcincta]
MVGYCSSLAAATGVQNAPETDDSGVCFNIAIVIFMAEQDTATGLVSATLATALYGSCYVPVRWFEAGDGMYFQWLMCIGQLISGVGVLALTGWPPIYPLALCGGMFFAIGSYVKLDYDCEVILLPMRFLVEQ